MNEPVTRKKFRFSIRALFVLILVAGVATYFVVLPDIIAARFVGHINKSNIDSAIKMFDDPVDFSHYWSLLAEQTKEKNREISATWKRPSFFAL